MFFSIPFGFLLVHRFTVLVNFLIRRLLSPQDLHSTGGMFGQTHQGPGAVGGDDEVCSCWIFFIGRCVFLLLMDFLSSKTCFFFTELEWGKLNLGALMSDYSVFYVRNSPKKNVTLNRRKENTTKGKRWQQPNFGATLLKRGSFFMSTWIETNGFVGSKNWADFDKGSSCRKHSPGTPTQLAKWAAPRPARQPCRWDLGQWPSCATDRRFTVTIICWVERWVG